MQQHKQNLIELDLKNREKALDCAHSFIVEAPAGSGKTTLLTQRLLALLATAVNKPEEILAITFTNKAAREMLTRIKNALEDAATHDEKESTEHNTTWQLAKKVLAKDQEFNWQLLTNLKRLHIQTIDSFCGNIVNRVSHQSSFGEKQDIATDAKLIACYKQAINELFTLSEVDPSSKYSQAIQNLLLHLDNDLNRIESLLINLLARRDHWLNYVVTAKELRHQLENNLRHIGEDAIENLLSHLPSKPLTKELLDIIKFSALNLDQKDFDQLNLETILDTTDEVISFWRFTAKTFLTKEYKFKKRLDKKSGFPSDKNALNKEIKKRAMDLLEQIRDNEKLRLALSSILKAPDKKYNEDEWQILDALFTLLPLLVAHLEIVFDENSLIDYTGISLEALNALGDSDLPTDLALNLDYRINHILIDEFQDTSVTQFTLLEKLTLGWQQDDGKTLFIVGDPMQSIYRFREAKVGLFLRAQRDGIKEIKLNNLALKINFRSDSNLINWFNHAFAAILPSFDDINLGQVSFREAVSFKETEDKENPVHFHSLDENDNENEAHKITAIIKERQQKKPNETIAILVRARPHLQEIIPALKEAQIDFVAKEAEKLKEQSIILDLLSLTKALHNFADRLAWLSILRAPWCGLTLSDLNALCGAYPSKAIWQLLNDEKITNKLSEDGQKRIQKLVTILKESFENREQENIATWIKWIWLKLGGPATFENEYQREYADNFFELINKYSKNGFLDLNLLEKTLNNLYINSDAKENCHVEIMTIHKAKGLEFDTVIIPGLNKTGRNDSSKLLLWQEQLRNNDSNELILAPLPKITQRDNLLYNYLKDIEKEKSSAELKRLLYVALTRAKKSIHLIATTAYDDDENFILPAKGSLANEFTALYDKMIIEKSETKKNKTESNINKNSSESSYLKRFNTEWQHPLVKIIRESEKEVLEEIPGYQDKNRAILGTVIHEILRRLSLDELPTIDNVKTFVEKETAAWKIMLLETGSLHENLSANLKEIKKAILNILQDEKGRWILDSKNKNAQSEYPLTSFHQETIKHVIIDRTFVDKDDVRWIIDYKTGNPENHEQYWSQLKQYKEIFSALEPKRTIKLALYYPLITKFIERSF